MTIARVQSGNTSTGSSSTPGATLTTAPLIGSLVTLQIVAGQDFSSCGNMTHVCGNDVHANTHLFVKQVTPSDSSAWSVTMAGSSDWCARVDEWSGFTGGFVIDQAFADTSAGSESSHPLFCGVSHYPSALVIAVMGHSESNASPTFTNSLTTDTNNLTSGADRSMSCASRVMTTVENFGGFSYGFTSSTTGGFAFMSIAPSAVRTIAQSLVLRIT